MATWIYDNEPTVFNQSIKDVFHYLFGFYLTMGKEPFDKVQAATSAKHFLILYNDISNRTGENLWKLKPKFHLFQELAEYQTHTSGDPSRFGAYADESFVGIIGKIAYSRGGCRVATTTPENVIAKYRAGA